MEMRKMTKTRESVEYIENRLRKIYEERKINNEDWFILPNQVAIHIDTNILLNNYSIIIRNKKRLLWIYININISLLFLLSVFQVLFFYLYLFHCISIGIQTQCYQHTISHTLT